MTKVRLNKIKSGMRVQRLMEVIPDGWDLEGLASGLNESHLCCNMREKFVSESSQSVLEPWIKPYLELGIYSMMASLLFKATVKCQTKPGMGQESRNCQ